jgi:hypothetical protein
MKKRDIQIVSAALMFGTLVWFSVALHEEYTVTVAAPLTLDGVDSGWAIKSPLPRSLQVRLHGVGWRLATLFLGPQIRLNYSYGGTPPAKRRIVFDDVAERISLRPGLEVAAVEPESISVELDRFTWKQVPVTLNQTLSFREGYGLVDRILLQPDSVSIGGAESLLRTIDAWPTTPMVFQDLKAPVEEDIPLAASPSYDITLSSHTVRLRLPIDAFAEKVFKGVPVEVTSAPALREVILIPPKLEVTVRGGINRLSVLTTGDFRAMVSYQEIERDTTGIIDVAITVPEGIQIVKKQPQRLQYIVRKKL